MCAMQQHQSLEIEQNFITINREKKEKKMKSDALQITNSTWAK